HSAVDEYARHFRSHTYAIISLSETAQELNKGAAEANKILSYLTRTQPISLRGSKDLMKSR
ncbi:unnamed protein product, partial [marine sediment metagenome]